MPFAPIGSRLFMDEIIFHKLWLEKQQREEESDSSREEYSEDEDSDVRQLFPKSKKSPEHKEYREINKVSKNEPPEWLAVFVGVFFVAGVAGIASYQAYSLDYKDQISNVDIQLQDMAHDAPPYVPVYDGIKLPTNLTPKAYVLYIHPNLKKRTYRGLVKISLFCHNSTDNIVLHSNKHRISKVEIKASGNDNANVKLKDTLRNRKREMLILQVEKTLQAGQSYDLFISFESKLTFDLGHGIYLSYYKDGNGKQRLMVSTDFEPTSARNAFPCFDEPELKATFKTIILHQKEGYAAVSNMPVEKVVTYGDDRVEAHFEVTPVMSTYLVVFAVTEYNYREVRTSRNLPIRVYAPSGRLAETTFAATVAPLCIDYYEEKFGVKFSLPKLDVVPIATMTAAADETWGMNIFDETYLLYNENTTTVSTLEYIATTIAHEFSHQWFGDLVTMKWWNDLWLKESFAAYLQYLPIQKYYPSWDLQTSFFSDNIHTALNFDSSKFTHPISSDALDPDELRTTYDAITYQKGAAVVAMLGDFLGEKTFLKGVNIFLTKYQYSNADADQFWQAMTEATNYTVDVVNFMNAWVKQRGFPLVTVKRDKRAGRFSQYRFSSTNSTASWHIPIKMKCAENTDIFSYTLSTREDSAVMCEPGAWYKLNYGASGFYRVNYDESNWNSLLKLLNDNHEVLPAIDRANVLSDIIELAMYRYHNISTALDFTLYLNKEQHYVPWGIGASILFHIRAMFYETKLKGCVESYLLKQISTPLEFLNTHKKHTHVQKHLIRLLLDVAISFHKEPITSEINNMFLKWVISGGTNQLSGSIRGVTYKAGIKYGQVYEWDYLFKRYQQAHSSEEQFLILRSLALTKDKHILQRYVNYTSNATLINPAHKAKVLTYVCESNEGRDIAWSAAKREWHNISASHSNDLSALKFLLNACLLSCNTEAELKETKTFFESIDTSKIRSITERIVERIERNIDFVKRKANIENWFRKHVPQCL